MKIPADPVNAQRHVPPLRSLCALILSVFFISIPSYAQEKHAIQIKTFDQQLQPYRNIEVSINGKEFISVGTKGAAFTEVANNDLPVKTIRIKNEQLEAASWNYSKGTLEIIVRRKSYQVARVLVKDENNIALPNLKLTFKGRKTIPVSTNAEGRIEIPLALDEKLTSADQFVADGYVMARLALAETENVLTAERIKPVVPQVETPAATNKPTQSRGYFKDFDLSKLDSIQSLTVFYAIFKNYDRKNLSAKELLRVDAKFNELVKQLEGTVISGEGEISRPSQERPAFIGRITDSTFIAEDIRNLLDQARQESQTLTEQRNEFDEKLRIINDKLASGVSNLDEETRKKLLSDLAMLERLLIENESRFYKNQNDYRQLINAIKEKFFEFKDLEDKLSESEKQRLEEQRIFRQRLIGISAVVLLFALLIVLLIYFSNALRKQKKDLVKANAEIKRINENLEGLVFERTRMLEEAHGELDTFLYRASHDMRSPVCSIIGLCNIASLLSEGEPKELIERVVTTTIGMDKLLKKLSIISEINRPSNFSSIAVAGVIEEVQHSFAKVILENRIEFIVSCPADLMIYSYPNLIQTIITNLTENALYYSSLKETTKPRVEVVASVQDNSLLIQVCDNGMGADHTIINRLFDMFFKGSEYSKGHGLGLYIVKKAVLALEGEVTAESEPGIFTKFEVVLPLKPAPASEVIDAQVEEVLQ
jgi:signal transduction histidine kinase